MIPFWLIGLVVGAVVLSAGSGAKDTRAEDARSRAYERRRRSDSTIENIHAETRQQVDETTQELANLSRNAIKSNLQKMQEGLQRLKDLKLAARNKETKKRLQDAIDSLSEKIDMIQKQS